MSAGVANVALIAKLRDKHVPVVIVHPGYANGPFGTQCDALTPFPPRSSDDKPHMLDIKGLTASFDQSQYGTVTRQSICCNKFSNCNMYHLCHGKNLSPPCIPDEKNVACFWIRALYCVLYGNIVLTTSNAFK